MSTALINQNILRWARERVNFEIDALAKKAGVSLDHLLHWEKGEEKPTFRQAQNLAKVLHIPFGYLFLSKPPVETKQLPDLRTVDDNDLREFSVDLRDTISESIRKQDWYSEYLKENGYEPCSFINRFQPDTPTATIVEDIVKTLELSIEDRQKTSNWEEFFRLLVSKAEDAGIWILRNGKVGNNTHRILNVEEFRGFALCDEYAPLIFINGADAKAAQIFTLIHEICHLWLGASGISDTGLNTVTAIKQNNIEKKCNEVAAELLVPVKQLKAMWITAWTVQQNATAGAKFFKVSPIVIARRALDTKLITKDDFFEYYREQQNLWRLQKAKEKDSPGGPSFYKIIPVVNGHKFTEAVLQSVFSQRTLIRDGARLLGVNASKLDIVGREVGVL